MNVKKVLMLVSLAAAVAVTALHFLSPGDSFQIEEVALTLIAFFL